MRELGPEARRRIARLGPADRFRYELGSAYQEVRTLADARRVLGRLVRRHVRGQSERVRRTVRQAAAVELLVTAMETHASARTVERALDVVETCGYETLSERTMVACVLARYARKTRRLIPRAWLAVEQTVSRAERGVRNTTARHYAGAALLKNLGRLSGAPHGLRERLERLRG